MFSINYKFNKNNMLKKIILFNIILLFFQTIVYSYTNPFWENKYKIVYKINKFIPNKLIFNFSNSFDIAHGINFGLFYEYNSSLNFSDSLFFTLKMSLGENIPMLKTFDTGIYYRPVKFISFELDYKFRNFMIYDMAEHGIIIKMNLMLNVIKYFTCNFESGLNLRFTDLNINDFKTQYQGDWLFNAVFIWKIIFMFHPYYLFSFGVSIGDIPDYEIYSFNYSQIEFINYLHLPKGFSIFLNGGVGFAGFFFITGIVNKGWIRLGLRYEIKTR